MSELVQRTCQVRTNAVTGSVFFCPGGPFAEGETAVGFMNTERCGKPAYDSVDFRLGKVVWMCFDHYFECTGGK